MAPFNSHIESVVGMLYNTHDGAVCIANDGAAARCALGLLVVVVLLLSHRVQRQPALW